MAFLIHSGKCSMKLITFAIWGNSPKYLTGAVKNAELATTIFPGWRCKYYVGKPCPDWAIKELESFEHVIVQEMQWPGTWGTTMWRFIPAEEDQVDAMISRDVDSRLSLREQVAVNEWLESGRQFHIMRDHPFHNCWPIMAGMWGIRPGPLQGLKSVIDRLIQCNSYGVDQWLLANWVYPRIKHSLLVHDQCPGINVWDRAESVRRFPLPRDNNEFVGQVFDENDNVVREYVQVLMEYESFPPTYVNPGLAV